MTIQEIAEALSRSPAIISTFRARIFFKTGMTSTQDIVQYVIDHNLLAVK